MADVGFNNRVGREEKWINTGAQERDLLLEECLPACLSHHLVRNEEGQVFGGTLLVPNTPERSWPFPGWCGSVHTPEWFCLGLWSLVPRGTALCLLLGQSKDLGSRVGSRVPSS